MQLAAYHRYLAFDEIAAPVVHKEIPVKLSSSSVTAAPELQEAWTGDTLSKDSGKQLIAHVRAYAARPVG